MRFLNWLFAGQDPGAQGYSTEVLCSNWVARPPQQPDAGARAEVLERLREAEAVTFLARIYACQRC